MVLFTVVFRIQKSLRLNALLSRDDRNQQAKVTGGFRFEISTKNNLLSELLRRAASQSFRAQSDTRGSSVQEADEGMVIISTKAVLSNTQASYSGRGP